MFTSSLLGSLFSELHSDVAEPYWDSFLAKVLQHCVLLTIEPNQANHSYAICQLAVKKRGVGHLLRQ